MEDAKLIQQLRILKNGVPAAELLRSKQGCEIRFDTNYLQSPDSTDLAFHLPLRKEPFLYSGVGLPPYFAGLLPEGLRLKALVRRIKTSEDDLFSLLVASGADPVGDLHFELNQEEIGEQEDASEIPTDFANLQKQMKAGADRTGKPIAGVQDKISADRISLPLRLKNKNKSYILKLPSVDFPDQVENEKACLEIAAKCGLQVNKVAVVKDKAGTPALLVERFDRRWDVKHKTWNRFHQEDACQFLDRYPADKYRLSFQEIAEGVVQWCASPELEVLNLLRLKAFSYLVGNGDLHAKNISLLQNGEGEPNRLSPVYDVVCTAIYGDSKMALEMDGKNQNLKRKNFVAFGERYEVPQAATESMLNRLVQNFKKNYEMMFSFPLALKKEKYLRQLFEERMKHLS